MTKTLKSNSNSIVANRLAQMQAQASNRLFDSEQAEIMAYNKTRIADLTNALLEFKATKLGKSSQNIWRELAFGYTVGSILGFLREAFILRDNRKEICDILGINEELVDYYYQFAGNAPYVKDGMIVEARPADIDNLKKLVYETAIQMQIIIDETDLSAITVENEQRRNAIQLQRQEDFLSNNSKVTNKVNVNNFFNS